jgi:hypothetical protein
MGCQKLEITDFYRFLKPGQSFGYDFDTIGNLKTENRNGNIFDYTANSVNQYTQRTIPGTVNVTGSADTDATVTIGDLTIELKKNDW